MVCGMFGNPYLRCALCVRPFSIHLAFFLFQPTLMACLFDRLPKLLESTKISMLIIDSIASPFLEERDYISRAETFRSIVHRLHQLQERHNFAICVTNQVRSVIDSSTLDDQRNVPALGLAWSTLVHTRLQLSRTTLSSNDRRCTIVFGPSAPPKHGFYQIDESGPVDTEALRVSMS